jgi:hypothetical protein
MRTKVTLVLVFLNVALFFFIFKFERNWRTEAASLETRRRVLGPEAADIRSITITHRANNTTVALTRQRDTWSLTQPLNWPANPHAARAIASEFELLEHIATFSVADAAKNKQTLADFGLEKPQLTVEFTSGDPIAGDNNPRPVTRLLIGDTTPDNKRLYVLSPDGQRVHVVNRSLLDTLTAPLESLRAGTLLTVRIFEARSLSIQTAAGEASTGAGAGLRVRIVRDANTQRWRFAAPHTAAGSKTAIELAINDLHRLQAKTFGPTPAPTILPSSAPAVRVTIESHNRQETLYLGNEVPATPGAQPLSRDVVELYAQLEGRDALFTVEVPRQLLGTLRNAQASLREKRILEFDPSSVAAVTLSAPVQPNQPPITLQRLEAPAGQNAGSETAWQVVHRSDGAQAPQTLPADLASVRELLQRLSLLAAESFKSDAPTVSDLEEWGFNRPLREVSLTTTGNPTPLVLRIGTDATRRVYYARVGSPTEPGSSIYTITPEIVEELALSPSRWRNRAVGEALPAAARIAGLKLTDLGEAKVLAEHTIAANGEVSPAPRDPQALGVVLAALRQLRAKEFLPGGFAERVFAAGEDRPWRFSLETTIALPSGTGQEVTRTIPLLLTERLSGSQQFAGARELDAVFALEQPLVDALWALAYGARDPGPTPKKN